MSTIFIAGRAVCGGQPVPNAAISISGVLLGYTNTLGNFMVSTNADPHTHQLNEDCEKKWISLRY